MVVPEWIANALRHAPSPDLDEEQGVVGRQKRRLSTAPREGNSSAAVGRVIAVIYDGSTSILNSP
jgi:hypothetical protein